MEALPAWQAWTRGLGDARLDHALLGTEGIFEGARVRVRHVPEAEGLSASLEVLVDAPLEPCFDARDSVDLPSQPKLEEPTRALAASVLEAGDLEVREDGVVVRVRATIEDPARVEGLLRKLIRLAARLRRGMGPYR